MHNSLFVLTRVEHPQVNYVNAHATSTIVGDLAEINAIKMVFPDKDAIKINATKVRAVSEAMAALHGGIPPHGSISSCSAAIFLFQQQFRWQGA